MRTLLLAGTSLLALSVSIAAASASATYQDIGSLQTYTVPTTGTYEIVAIGAQGGNGGDIGGTGGFGARLEGPGRSDARPGA
jgi:predicted secreted Zn-dependent protease